MNQSSEFDLDLESTVLCFEMFYRGKSFGFLAAESQEDAIKQFKAENPDWALHTIRAELAW